MAKETLRISYKFKNKRVREAVFTYSVKNNISVQQMIEDAMKNTHPTLYK